MAEINDLNVTDASNTARFPENQAPSTVNDGARALEGLLARWFQDSNGSVTSGGSANAYTFTANQTLSAYYQGMLLTFEANFTNTGACTLNVDGIGAKSIIHPSGQALVSGQIISGGVYQVVYEGAADSFILLSATGGPLTMTTASTATNITALNTETASAGSTATRIDFTMNDDGAAATDYARLTATAEVVTAASEDGSLALWAMNNGTLKEYLVADGNNDLLHTSGEDFGVGWTSSTTAPSASGDEGILFQPSAGSYVAVDTTTPLFVHQSANDATDRNVLTWVRNGSNIASVTSDDTTVTYNTSSDERLKENFRLVEDAIQRVRDLKPTWFTWKQNEHEQIGFVAQWAKNAAPWAMNLNPDTGYYQMDYSQVTGLLAAAIIELADRIKELET